MSITKENKTKLIKDNQSSAKDTGSSAVQVAVLTERIKNLTEHFKSHKKDNHSKVGLIRLVNRRKKLLSYVKSKNEQDYLDLIKKLGIRK